MLNIEKLRFESEQDEKYSGEPRLMDFFHQPMSNFECCWKLNKHIGIWQSYNIINLETSWRIITKFFGEFVLCDSILHFPAVPLQESLTEVVQVSSTDNSGVTLENWLQESLLAPGLENICEEPISITIQDSSQDPSQQSLEVLQNKMLFQPEYLELSLQESFTIRNFEFAENPLLDACVNDIAVHKMQQ